MSTTTDQPRTGDGRFDIKRRTEPAFSLGTVDDPVTSPALREWVTARTRAGGALCGSSLVLADLSGMDLPGLDVATADLWGATFDRTDMPGANLANCDARNASFAGTHMPGANLCGTDLTGARFDDATNLTGARWDERTSWPSGYEPDPAGMIRPADDDLI